MVINRQFKDIDQIGELARHWDLDFRQTQAGEISAALVQHVQPDFQFAWASFSHCVMQRGVSPGAGRTFALLDQRSPLAWCGQAPDRDTLMAFDPSGAFESLSAPGFTVFTLTISESAWQDAAHQRLRWEERDDLTKPALLSARPPLIHGLRQHLRNYRQQLIHQSAMPAWSAPSADNCIDALFAVIADGTRQRAAEENRSQRVRALRKACELIYSRGGAKIQVAELCAAAGVSERTLQYAFRAQTGQTPKAFIRSYRLDRVRQALRHDDREPISVVARRWGFTHLGQFARYYRQQFGELPSETV